MKNIPDYTQTHSAILKTPIARILELFSEMLQGRIKLSINGRKYIFYMYLLLVGSCTRNMVPLLLGMADRAINNAKPHTPQKNLITSKTVDDFLSLRLRHRSISKTVLKSRILYQLTADGYRELATFLSALPTASGCDASFIKWCMSDAHRLVENHSVHSANVGLILTHIAARCCLSVTEFALNTPLDSHGSIYRNGFNQSTNRFRSDAYLSINSPCRLEIFFENDMGTERMEAIAAKMERYFALIFSVERELRTSSVHFSIGDYHKNDNISHYDSRIITPSKYTLQVYRACTSTFISTVHGLYGSCPHDPGGIIKLMHTVCTAPDAPRNNIMTETVKYLEQIYGLCPIPPDILSYFENSFASENVQNSLYRIRPDKTYLKRREKIFEWCRSAPDISMLIKRGFRITASDNCCDGTDFIYSYPHLYPGGMENYLTLIEKHISGYSYRGKFTDLPPPAAIQYSSLGFNNISFFPIGDTFYPFANCFSLHHHKGSFQYSFENITNDISARMRLERYLENNAPCIPGLHIFIIYTDDLYSLQYIETIRSKYGPETYEHAGIQFIQVPCIIKTSGQNNQILEENRE